MDCKHGLQSNIVSLFTSECGSNRAAAVLAKKAGEEAEIEGLEQELEGLREECDRADRAAAEYELPISCAHCAQRAQTWSRRKKEKRTPLPEHG